MNHSSNSFDIYPKIYERRSSIKLGNAKSFFHLIKDLVVKFSQSSINILQINSVCGIGSTGRIATDLHEIVLSQGYASTVAFGRDRVKNCSQSIRIGGAIDNYLHVAHTRLFDSHGFASKHSTKEFINKIRVLNPDVIHLHNLHGYYLHIGVLFEYLKHTGKPVIWTLHDCWAFTGHCTYFDIIDCNRWKNQCYSCQLKSEYPKSLLLDRSKWNFKQKKKLFTGLKHLTIVTPSQWLQKLVKESFLKEYPVKVIHNGVDLDVFNPTQSDFRNRYRLDNQYVLLGVASIWEERKGYQYFVDLAKQLSPDEKIVLVGISEKNLKHLPAGVIGITRTNSIKALAEIYSAADLFINPTLEDNFPTTNLESLACGTPVVTFNSGGSPECLDDGSGLVVKRGNLIELMDAITTVRKNGKAFYSDQCRNRAIEYFDKNARFAEYLTLYERYLRVDH